MLKITCIFLVSVLVMLVSDVTHALIADDMPYTKDDNVLLLPMADAVERYKAIEAASKITKRQTQDIFVGYLLFATCNTVTFWIIDFSNHFADGWMEVKAYTDPNDIPLTWTTVNRNLGFSLFGLPTFITTFGRYEPCSNITIMSRLKNSAGLTRLGQFTLATDCPCHPCIGCCEPHYIDFQQQNFEFNGRCSYIMTEACNRTAEHTLKVVVTHADLGGVYSNAQRISKAEITADGVTVNMEDDGSIKVNGLLITENMYMTDDLLINVDHSSSKACIIFSDVGKWWVEWDKHPTNNRNRIVIGIQNESPLIGNVCGMMGPKRALSDARPFEYFTMASGAHTLNTDVLGNSWAVPGSCPE